MGALAAYNRTVGVAISMDVALASRQRALVAQADLQAWQSQLETSCPARKALLLSEAEPGGRAFLAAVPAGRKRMEPAVFTAELRHRFGVAEASADGWCPRCDGVLDTFSLHAEPAASGTNVTTLSGTWCALGRTGLACSQRRSDLAYFSHSALKTLALLVGALQTSLPLASLASLLHLTSPLPAFSGRLA